MYGANYCIILGLVRYKFSLSRGHDGGLGLVQPIQSNQWSVCCALALRFGAAAATGTKLESLVG